MKKLILSFVLLFSVSGMTEEFIELVPSKLFRAVDTETKFCLQSKQEIGMYRSQEAHQKYNSPACQKLRDDAAFCLEAQAYEKNIKNSDMALKLSSPFCKYVQTAHELLKISR